MARTPNVNPKPSGDASPAGTSGVLPSQALRALVASGIVRTAPEAAAVDGAQIQPASIDLRLGPDAYRIRASFLPGSGTRVEDKLRDLTLHRFALGAEGKVLEVGCVYLIPLLEGLSLPPGIEAFANPKSSTGRLDVFTRVIADGVTAFDKIPKGFSGALWLEVCPQSFPILVREGTRLSQLRFRHGEPVTDDAALLALHQQQGLVTGPDLASHHADISGGIALSVDLSGDGGGLIGYRAKRHSGVIDVDAPGSCETLDFWEPILSRGTRRMILDPDQFYILASKEAVHIPPTHAAEMMPFNPLVGEFRVHYAGFMDPGFGHAEAGGSGSRIVLEVRSHKVPFILDHGQIIGRLVYERMSEIPDKLYGAGLGSNYQAQGLKLSKHFR